ncbi:hypothetical protein HDV06_003386 [Boothiomyces sp. JEL0866]|nr:hypothetical protein HDV06_003386 [Boothiomyces sp. JEL0866]
MKEYEIEKVAAGSTTYWICTHHSCRGSEKHFVKEASAKSHYTRTHVHSKHDQHTETEDEEEKGDNLKSNKARVDMPEAVVEEHGINIVKNNEEMQVDQKHSEADNTNQQTVLEEVMEEDAPLGKDSETALMNPSDSPQNLADEMEGIQSSQNATMEVEEFSADATNSDEHDCKSFESGIKETENIPLEKSVKYTEINPEQHICANEGDKITAEMQPISKEPVNITLEAENQESNGDNELVSEESPSVNVSINTDNANPVERSIQVLEDVGIQTEKCEMLNDIGTFLHNKELQHLLQLKDELKMEIDALKNEELSISKEVGELSRYKSNIIAEKYLLSEEIANLQDIRNDLMEKVTKEECKKDERKVDEIEKVQGTLNMNQIMADSLEGQLSEIQNENVCTVDKIQSLNETILKLNEANSELERNLVDLQAEKEEAVKKNIHLLKELENISPVLASAQSDVQSNLENLNLQKAKLAECLGEKKKAVSESFAIQLQLETVEKELRHDQDNHSANYQKLMANKSSNDAQSQNQMELINKLKAEISDSEKIIASQEIVQNNLINEKDLLLKTQEAKSGEIEKLTNEVETAKHQLGVKEARVGELKAQIDRFTDMSNTYDMEITQNEIVVQDLKEKAEGQQIEISERTELISNLTAVLDADKLRLLELETQIEQKSQEIVALQKELDSAATKNESALLAFESGQAQILVLHENQAKIQSHLDDIVRETSAVQENIALMQSQMVDYENSLEQLRNTASSKALLLEETRKDFEFVTSEIQKYKVELSQITEMKMTNQNNLELLKESIREAEVELHKMDQEKQQHLLNLEKVKQLTVQISTSKEKAAVIDQELAEKEKQLDDLMVTLQPKLTRLELITNSFNQKNDISSNIKNDIEQMQSDIISLQFDIETKKMKLQAVSSELAEKSSANQSASEELLSLENDLKELDGKHQQHLASVSEMKEKLSAKQMQLGGLTEQHQSQQIELQEMDLEIQQKDKEINDIQIKIEESRSKLMSARIEVDCHSSTLESINEEITSAQNKLKSLLEDIELKKRKHAEISASISAAETDVNSLADQLTPKPTIDETVADAVSLEQIPNGISDDSKQASISSEVEEAKENSNTNIPHSRVNSESKLPKRSIPVPKTRLALRKAQEETKILKKPKLNNE